ncbi:hypothetical protein BROUX41_000636 [Berkeleyomyces rouxiae]|uniref:uncharacterized protein n=1 Tax=Berkeleyomyces rouxiae TaxID=2035830 RepID=UPI003B82199D
MSSLSRAFTNRRAKISLDIKESKDFLNRSTSTKNNNAARPKISGPVQLVHTTNMLSYNAPDINAARRIPSSSSQSSAKSDAEYLTSPASYSASAASTAPTSPESSICERPTTPEMFDIHPSSKPMMTSISGPVSSPGTFRSDLPPAIPRRAPSHTKKASIDAARQRSGSFTPASYAPAQNYFVSRSASSATPPSPNRSVVSKSSMTFSRASTTSTSTTATSHSSFAALKSPPMPSRPVNMAESPYDSRPSDMASPFGHELAQVAEIAEEFGFKQRLEVIDEEERELHSRGLYKIAPEVYLRDIKAIRLSFFPESVIPNGGVRPAAVWI